MSEKERRDPKAGPAGGKATEEGAAGADADESGYRRDDYWRESAQDGVEPGDVPKPPQGYAFEDPDERGQAPEPDDEGRDDTPDARDK